MNNIQDRSIVDPHVPRPNFIPTAPVIEGVEEFGSWVEHREIVVQELCPFGALEALYAERVALFLWRLDRVIGLENAAARSEFEAGSTTRPDESDRVSKRSVIPDRPTLQTIIRYEAHLDRCLARTMAELRRLQKERRQGLRHANLGREGADRAGVCQHDLDEKGSHGYSPSPRIIRPEMSIPVGLGAERVGVCQTEFDTKGSHVGSPSPQITGPEMSIPSGRGDDRADVCLDDSDENGSHGGSPSRKSSPSQAGSTIEVISAPEMSAPQGRGADRAEDCQYQKMQDCSPGCSRSETGSPAQKSSPIRTGARNQTNSTSRKHVASKRASPIPKTPPLLASITNRRRLEEYTLGQIFEQKLGSATLDFAMIPKPTTFA